MPELQLIIGMERLAIVRFKPDDPLPEIGTFIGLWSLTRTEDELSVVLPENYLLPGWKAEPGWRYLKVKGPLEFSLTGILASIAAPLARAGISIFAISTFDTDYILVKETDLEKAVSVLRGESFSIIYLEQD